MISAARPDDLPNGLAQQMRFGESTTLSAFGMAGKSLNVAFRSAKGRTFAERKATNRQIDPLPQGEKGTTRRWPRKKNRGL